MLKNLDWTVLPDDEEKFRDILERWTEATQHLASPKEMVDHPFYQEFINMGGSAVVLMLGEFQKGNIKRFFHALRVITGAQPIDFANSPDEREAANDWIRWGIRNGVIE